MEKVLVSSGFQMVHFDDFEQLSIPFNKNFA